MEEATGRPVSAGRLEKLNQAGLLGQSTDNNNDATFNDDDDDGGDFDDDYDRSNNPWGGVVITRLGGIDPVVLSALRALFSTDAEWQAAGEAVGNFVESVSVKNERAALLVAKTAMIKQQSSAIKETSTHTQQSSAQEFSYFLLFLQVI